MSTPKTNCCTGECCASFTLKWGAKKRFSEYGKDESDPHHEKYALMGEMLKFIKHDPGHSGSAHYTCRFWDRETKLCTVYEKRPEMCSEFPYDGVCGICGLIGPQVRVGKRHTEEIRTIWCCTDHMKQYGGKCNCGCMD